MQQLTQATSMPDTMTIDELARQLKINRSTAYERARLNDLPIPVIRIGRRLMVSRRAYDALMSAQKPTTSEAA